MSEPVEVRLLDKEYLVACAESERPGLIEAARLLDERLRAMRQANKTATLERIAVLAALNLAHERLQAQAVAKANDDEVERLIREVDLRLGATLDAPRR